MTGRVFNVQKFSVDDGPGIRTLVFLKGCPLRCEWCSNPESQLSKPQVMYYPKKCRGCGKCIANCPQNCIRTDQAYGIITDHNLCIGCGKCEEMCLFNARKLMGKDMTVEELMDVVMDDYDFYRNSGGGVTFSGGEPLMQPDFLRDMLKACKENEIHTAVETCGYVSWESFEKVVKYLDLIFFDFKHYDCDVHKKFTGVGNEKIKENLKKLNEIFDNIVVRIPYIPGFNDGKDHMQKILEELEEIKINNVEVLPYHRIGRDKYRGLGMPYQYESIKSLQSRDIAFVEALGKRFGINIKIGGNGR